MTSAFSVRDGALCAENVPLEKIAAETGTPFYCYSAARIRQNYRDFTEPFTSCGVTIYYAVKACPNKAVIHLLAACGGGADVTSAGEMERALAGGVPPEKIVFSGVGKRRDEIMAALIAGIHQINVESMPELELISRTASALGRTAPITLRVNPDVDARTYKKTSTAELGTKFGIDHAQLDEAMRLATTLPGLAFKGFTVHVGSHVHDYEPFRLAYQKMAGLVRAWRAKGIAVERLDLGGGVGIAYDDKDVSPFADYAKIVIETVGDLGCELSFEPGRRLVGDAGMLVSRVVYVKEGASKRFVIIDAGMNDLIRPAMYGARHSIVAVREKKAAEEGLADVVGPVCETSDLFGENYRLPGVEAGDLVAILQAGAYGSAMASAYNGRALIPEILVDGSDYFIVRRRIAVAEQLEWEGFPQESAAKTARDA